MNDFTDIPPDLRAREIGACERVLASGWSILGKEVEAFEEAWARAIGVRHAIGVANGMDALEISLRAAGIGPGDEVITTPMTAFATVLAILRAGAVPVLGDIEPETACLSLDSVERCLGPRTRAVMPVHLYGRALPLDRWSSFCAERQLLLIEDCAQAHLARWQGRPVGSWGIAAGWSFYPTKNLGACGDGGAITTDDDEVAVRCRELRNYGQRVRYHHPVLGLNSRLDEIQAALLGVRLRELEAWTGRRRAIAARYRQELGHPGVRVLADSEPKAHVHHLFIVLCDERDRLAEHLKAKGIQTLIHYPIPVHLQEPMRSVRRDPAGLSACERHAARCLSLPCHPYLSEDEITTVIAAVNSFR